MSGCCDIAMGFDGRYAPHAAAVIASIVRHAPEARLRFIIVHDGVDGARQAKVESVAPKARFVWRQVSASELPEFQYGHLSRAILFRLGLEQLAPADCARVIYVDSDVVVMGDIRELAAADLGDCVLGAAPDRYVDPANFAKRWGLSSPAPRYFNSGVLVIELGRVRAERLFSAAIDFVSRHRHEIEFADQDALNFVFWERWKPIDSTWNVQQFTPAREIVASGKAPKLLHFIGLEKPWLPNIWHPWAWAYWDNLKRTPFEAEVARTQKMNIYQLLRLRMKWWLNHPPTERAR